MSKTTDFAHETPKAIPASAMILHAPEESLSPWLYLAGLCVTLSGLYAVNFGIEDPNFALITYTLAIVGYATSYFIRHRNLSNRFLQAPLAAVVIFLLFGALSSDSGLSWFAPPSPVDDRARSLQLVFMWLGILQTYTLSANAAVLFACVPCMTMIALVSTQTSEPQVQNAFLIFICAATFLMIHENFLRTRTATLLGRTAQADRRLFGAQLQLAAFCFVSALGLAYLVAVPVQTVGQKFFIPAGMAPMNQTRRSETPAVRDVPVVEEESVLLARGPQAENDTPLLKVRSDHSLYLRGTTFDFYTGASFENTVPALQIVEMQKSDPQSEAARYGDFGAGPRPASEGYNHRFQIPPSPLELEARQMKNAVTSTQEITVLGGTSRQVYGAPNIREVRGPFQELQTNAAGNLRNSEQLQKGTTYTTVSLVANTSDETALRAAAPRPVPLDIAQHYLQVANSQGQENPRLRELAQELTRGKTNNYDKAVAIQQFIAQNCKYNLQAPAAPTGADAVEYFLFESKQGYCDAFGAAMTMLCRYAGIPARLASGFITLELDSDGVYIVKEKNKHIWSEVFFPRIGWLTFDATEGSEDISDHAGKNNAKRKGFLAWFMSQGIAPPLIGCVILASLVYLFKTEGWDRYRSRRRKPRAASLLPATNIAVVQAYTQACTLLARRGFARLPSQTPDEYARALQDWGAESLGGFEAPFSRLTALCNRFRYSAETAEETDVLAARNAAAEITEALAETRWKRVKAPPSPASAT